MTKRKHKRKLPDKKITALLVVLGVAIIGCVILAISKAATLAVSSEAESGTRTTKAALISDSTASGGSAVKFGTASSGGGGGICTNPIGSVQNRDSITIAGFNGAMSVRNEAWNGLHGPQTTYVCNEQSWYSMSNQPNNGGQVETYPDTLYSISGSKTIAQYNSITSTFGEAYQPTGGWDATYDLWVNDWSTEIMIWNEWHGSPGYWPTQANTAVTLGGVPYHFLNNGGTYQFFRDTQSKTGSVDILAAYKFLISKNLLKTTDVPTQIEYGVEVCDTAGTTERFDTTAFTVSLN